MIKYPYTTIQNYLVLIFTCSFAFEKRICIYKTQANPPHLTCIPPSLFTSNPTSLLCPSIRYIKNKTQAYYHYQYIVLYFMRNLVQTYKNVNHVILQFPFPHFENFYCNTHKSHVFYFTYIQHYVLSFFHFVAEGSLSHFQFMATTATAQQTT